MAERVRLDRSPASVLAVCTCGQWRHHAGDAAEAARAGAEHLTEAHDAGKAASDLLRRNGGR